MEGGVAPCAHFGVCLALVCLDGTLWWGEQGLLLSREMGVACRA